MPLTHVASEESGEGKLVDLELGGSEKNLAATSLYNLGFEFSKHGKTELFIIRLFRRNSNLVLKSYDHRIIIALPTGPSQLFGKHPNWW